MGTSGRPDYSKLKNPLRVGPGPPAIIIAGTLVGLMSRVTSGIFAQIMSPVRPRPSRIFNFARLLCPEVTADILPATCTGWIDKSSGKSIAPTLHFRPVNVSKYKCHLGHYKEQSSLVQIMFRFSHTRLDFVYSLRFNHYIVSADRSVIPRTR